MALNKHLDFSQTRNKTTRRRQGDRWRVTLWLWDCCDEKYYPQYHWMEAYREGPGQLSLFAEGR